jgi:regulator of protease activity HflC (stomatin/prohibitin superfamily)
MTKNYFNPILVLALIILVGSSFALYHIFDLGQLGLVALLLVSVFASSSIHIADQWERAVVLRMGKYKALKGPGLFFIVPIFDSVADYIDQRIRVTEFKAEQTLTKDTVPVNVDAVVYWTVWDVEKAALEVQDYITAISYIAQTGLRDIIGKNELSDLLQERDKIAEGLQKALDSHTNPWGITCQNVGIKDIIIPPALADAMSKEAQAERERHS